MIYNVNKKSTIKKIVVFITFLIAIGLYYSNPDQFISDNSLFYPVVAENILKTGISTFNGYIETNGYQPLWMLFSVFAVFLSSIFTLDVLIVLGVIYHLFLLGSIIIVFKMAERWKFFSAPIIAITLIFMFVANGVLHNMESAMALFFVLLTLYYALTMETVTIKRSFFFGLLVGMVFLSRFDLLFFGMIITTYTFFVFRKQTVLVPLVIVSYLLGFFVVVLPYLIYNITIFDQFLPMFNVIEEGFPTLSYALENIYPYGTVSLLIAFIEWGVAWTAKSKQIRVIILIMSLSTIFQIIYVAFFQHPQSWYFITGFINFAVIVGYFIYKININWLTNIVFITLIIMTIGSAYLKTISNYALSAHVLKLYQGKVGKAEWLFSGKSEKKRYAEDVMKNIPKNTTVSVGYFPGSLAYYAKLKVFAANGLSDGLIPNRRFDKELTTHGVEATMKKYGIKYHIVPLSYGAVLWYGKLGFNVLEDDGYLVMNYSKLSSKICTKMKYADKKIIPKVVLSYASTGYAGIFHQSEMFDCSNKEVNDLDTYYTTTIGM